MCIEFRLANGLHQLLNAYLIALMQLTIILAIFLNCIVGQMHEWIIRYFALPSRFVGTEQFLFILKFLISFIETVSIACQSCIAFLVQINLQALFLRFPQHYPHSDVKFEPSVQKWIHDVLLDYIAAGRRVFLGLVHPHTYLLAVFS